MIIWLASYPKSGNTWIRSFLISMLFSNDGTSNLEDLNMIGQYPVRSQFRDLVQNFSDINQIKQKWIESQKNINFENKVKFYKTHHSMVALDNFNFTDNENTLGVIYIVRDPRNIVSSVKKHYSFNSIQDAKKFMFHEEAWTGFTKEGEKVSERTFPTLISSWGFHYQSWKQIKKNYLLIKYENLIKDPYTEFRKIIIYLEEILKVKFEEKKFKKAVETNNFENLRAQERGGKFKEHMIDKNNQKIDFFNKGPKSNWKEQLDKKIALEFENKFYKELVELGYLK